jgi:ribulose-phosphate 3-epimerase
MTTADARRVAPSPRVSASLWSVDRASLDDVAERLVGAGLRSWHWDFADGTLGPAGGFEAVEGRRIAELTGLSSDVHLMMDDPRDAVTEWAEFCEIVTVHYESPHWREAVTLIEGAGARAAVAVSPGAEADVDELAGYGILVMSVRPGHAGETFDDGCLQRIGDFAGHDLLGIDGSLTPERAALAVARGATWLVSGTSLVADPGAWLNRG